MEDEYTIGINKNTMCKLKLFKSIDELVYFGKSINRLAMTNIFGAMAYGLYFYPIKAMPTSSLKCKRVSGR